MIDLKLKKNIIDYTKKLIKKIIMVKGVYMMEIKENNLLGFYLKI